jgi:protein-disulfide isomerase
MTEAKTEAKTEDKTQAKTDVGTLVIVAALALIIGIGTGAFLAGESESQPGSDPGMGKGGPGGPMNMEGGAPPMGGGGSPLAAVDHLLQERFLEVAALERLAIKAEMRLDGAVAQPAAPVAKAVVAPKPIEKEKLKRPRVLPKVIGKDVPKPKAAPKPPAQETTSAVALSRQGKYNTKLGPSPSIGPDDAPVKVFIISDFQCPVCRRAANGSHELFDQFGKDVQWVFWQNPLDMHRKAMPTSKASMAAFRQGKFWEYHDLMFQNQRAAEQADLEGFATELGLDLAQFKKDMEDPELEKKIRSDQAAAENLGARGTPAFVINGRLQVGWGSAAGIGSMITREQAEMKKLLDSGTSLKDALAKRAEANAKKPEEAPVFTAHFLEGKPAIRKPKEEAKTD